MTTFYEEMAQSAKELLAEFGPLNGFICRRTVNGRFDKVAGAYTAQQTEEQVMSGVSVPVNSTEPNRLDISFSGETLTPSQVMLLKVAAYGLEFEPQIGDIVLVGESELPIVACTPVQPGDTAILYTLALKK